MDVVGGQHGLRVALADAVVGDGDGPVAHAVGQADDLAGVAETVHGAGLGMQVQLHPALAFGRGILPRLALHLQDVIGVQHIVALVLVVAVVAADDEGGARLDGLPLAHVGAVVADHLDVDRTGVVGDGSEIDLAAAALDLGGEHVAPDGDLAAVAQVVEGAQVGRLEIFAVEHLDRLVRQVQALHLDGRQVLLGLELDGRGLALDVAFKLLRRHGLAGGGHAHDGQGAGALLDALGQAAGEIDAFQNVHAGGHVDNDLAVFDGDGGLVQKAVDGQALGFQLLDELAGGVGGDGTIVEVVFQSQLVALEHRLQRRGKAPAQRAVQRLGAAQADDDPAGSAVKLNTLHQHLPEAGIELGVGRKLRPDLGDKGFQGGSFLV